jgi:hypothetical protein
MASTVRNLQSGSFDRREGIDVLTKEQQVNTSFIRVRPNSTDLLVHLGRKVEDNFFDENLFDANVSGSITSAPNNYAEKRTLGQCDNVETTFTDMQDFDPVVYLQDEGVAIFPSVLIAQGYSDPINSDATMGIFESRKEIVGFVSYPDFAKRGAKASLCSTAESIDHRFYLIDQSKPRKYESSLGKFTKYIEATDESNLIETTTYQDQDSSSNRPFVDDYDTSVTLKMETGDYTDDEIASVILSGHSGCSVKSREIISAAAGWVFLNNVNGTDSIVYSDRT